MVIYLNIIIVILDLFLFFKFYIKQKEYLSEKQKRHVQKTSKC